MPGFNKTGPVGLGAQTGRKRGRCQSEGSSDNGTEVFSGRGQRMRLRFFQPEQENNEMFSRRRFGGQRRGKR